MKILVSRKVHLAIEEFYDIALQRHPTLDEETVIRKMKYLIAIPIHIFWIQGKPQING